jgi:SAM-dependent methyltransferase
VNAQNSRTLAAYEAHVPEYLDSTSPILGPHVTEWLDAVVAPHARARILEIGSGPGTVAEHLITDGHLVDLSDAAMAFVEHLRARGHDARLFNVLTDPVPGGYDVILAHAVLLHLTRPQFAVSLRRLQAALAPGGRLAFTVKQGDGEEWSTAKLGAPRYFCYWQSEPLRDFVSAAGFISVQVTRWTTPSGQPFLAVIADS